MKRYILVLATVLVAQVSLRTNAGIVLGTAGDFAVLAASTVTNTGPTVINGGDVGPSVRVLRLPDFNPSTRDRARLSPPYTTDMNDALAAQGQNDLTTAYNAAAALAPTQVLTGQDLGGLTLTPGVYFFASSAQLTGILTLNNEGDADAQFVFQIASTLTTASSSSVVTINGGSMPGCNVFWQVGSSATLGTETAFEGHILADASITLTTGATILDGSALAMTGAVTLDSNSINNCVVPLPEPVMAGLALLPLAWFNRKRSAIAVK